MTMKRMRGRGPHRSGGGPGGGGGVPRHQSGSIPLNRNHVFDSTGPNMRVRGTAQQVFDKYLQVGRDLMSEDRVMAEACFQHAEHYFRIVGAMQAAQQQSAPLQQQNASVNGNGGSQNHRARSQADTESAQDAVTEMAVAGAGEQPQDSSASTVAPPDAL